MPLARPSQKTTNQQQKQAERKISWTTFANSVEAKKNIKGFIDNIMFIHWPPFSRKIYLSVIELWFGITLVFN